MANEYIEKVCKGECPKCGSKNIKLVSIDGSIYGGLGGEIVFIEKECEECGLFFVEEHELYTNYIKTVYNEEEE